MDITAEVEEIAGDDDGSSTGRADDLVYVVGLEKYIIGRNGVFHIDQPVGQDAAYKYLVGLENIHPKQAGKCLKLVGHPVVHTVDCRPDEQVLFKNEEGETVLNGYVKPTVLPKQGDWPRLAQILCTLTGSRWHGGPSEATWTEDYSGAEWVFNWMAAKLQAPGRRGMTTPVFTGPQGCGKTAFGEFFATLLGSENTASISGKNLKDGFNSQFATKLFVNASEVIQPTGDRFEIIETMKVYITDERVTLMTPHAKRVLIPNRMSFWMTSNSSTPVKVEGEDERRYSIFAIPKAAVTAEYKALVDSLYDKKALKPTPEAMLELQAMAYDLAAWEVDWDMAKRPFRNQARKDLALASRSGIDAFLDEIEESKGVAATTWASKYLMTIPEKDREDISAYYYPGEGLTTDIVFKAYVYFCKVNGYGNKTLTFSRFGMDWKNRFGNRWKNTKLTYGAREHVYQGLELGSPEMRREAALAALGAATADELSEALQRALAKAARKPVDNPDFTVQ